jgi:hypothetical protein
VQVTSTPYVRVAWAILCMTVILLVLGLVLPRDRWLTLESGSQLVGNGLLMLACSAVGILIVSRRPGNVIGWIFLLVPPVMAASQVADGYARRSLPGFMWVALLPDLLWIAAVPLGAMLVMLLFPTGHLPSRRWRPVVWATVAATAVVVVATALTPGPVEYFPDLQNPLGLAGAGPALDLSFRLDSW